MCVGKFVNSFLLIAVAILGMWVLYPAVTSVATAAAADNDGMEVLTRGPIHEAFADVGVNEVLPAAVIRRSVPEPIKEVPPDYRPEGDNVQWIPGYWSWDDEQNDFVWVSGIWRDVPPGRQWIPGYWIAVEDGSRFVSGYWTDIEESETVYLPPPPEQMPAAPVSTAVSSDSLWIDGHWLWSGSGYAWQSGYWLRQRPAMIWVPAHYVWTPRGHVFVRGYWDYHYNRRGLLFAPRYYPRPSYISRGYHYTPSIALNIDSIFHALFIRKNHHHYYFGDYFDHRYERRGFLPWYSRYATRYGHDPCYRGYRWHQLRVNKHWEHNYHQQYQFRRDHIETRPPPLYRAQVNHDSGRALAPPQQVLGRPLIEVVQSSDQPVRFTRLNTENKKEFQRRDRRLTAFQAERRNVEMAPENERRSRRGSDLNRPERVRLSASPITGRSGRDTVPEVVREERRDNRGTNLRQRTFSGLNERKQEVSQPVRPVDVRKGNEQVQTRQGGKQFRRTEERHHNRSRAEQRTRPVQREIPVQRVGNTPGSQLRNSEQLQQRMHSPVRVEKQRSSPSRVERQRTRFRDGKDQPDFRTQVQQQRRSLHKMEDRSRGRTQNFRQTVQPRNIENRKFVQPQVSEKRRHFRRSGDQDKIRPRVDQQQRRSRDFNVQKSGSPRNNQFSRQPRQHKEQMRESSQFHERKERRQNRSGEHRRNRNR